MAYNNAVIKHAGFKVFSLIKVWCNLIELFRKNEISNSFLPVSIIFSLPKVALFDNKWYFAAPETGLLKEKYIPALPKKEADEVAQADRQYDNAHKALTPLRIQADELIDEIIAGLDYNLRKLDPSNKRRIMRSYGVTYKYAPGEPEDVPTPPATETK